MMLWGAVLRLFLQKCNDEKNFSDKVFSNSKLCGGGVYFF